MEIEENNCEKRNAILRFSPDVDAFTVELRNKLAY
jgi:hypothetical protein